MKPQTRSLTATPALFLLVFFPLGCAKKEQQPAVGFAQMENNSPFRIAETNSMKAAGREHRDKYSFISTDAQGDTAKQVSDVETLSPVA